MRFRAGRWALLLILGLVAAVGVAAVVTQIPRNAAGMAARSVCSAVFVAGRDAQAAMAADVRPASPALALVNVEVDATQRRVTGRFAGLFPRTAHDLGERGCVLDAPPGDAVPRSKPPTALAAAPWPQGNAARPASEWPQGVDAPALQRVADAAFIGAGDPKAANARAFAVVHRGQLLVNRQAPGFEGETALHGWSMTKTLTAMLAHKLGTERGIDTRKPVVDSFRPGAPVPAWVQEWRRDARARISLDDLLAMRDGLANTEDYGPAGDVPRMLFGASDAAAQAAAAKSEAPPAQRFRYLSASSNILAAVWRSYCNSTEAHARYPRQALFEPIGAHSAVLETDAAGQWLASSYAWASSGDWARLGLLLLQDGQWQGQTVLPPGFLARAGAPAMKEGEGLGYGAAQIWRIGDPTAGSCKGQVPPDTLALRGHWGQIVAIAPSREAVVVRLGWTMAKKQFDPCRLVADVLKTLGA